MFKELHAEYMAETTLEVLKNNGISNTRILSQCHDGSKVMSGKEGGVQKLIQNSLKRKISYIHCLNHLFHLVLIKVIESVQAVKFDQVKHIATLFCRHGFH